MARTTRVREDPTADSRRAMRRSTPTSWGFSMVAEVHTRLCGCGRVPLQQAPVPRRRSPSATRGRPPGRGARRLLHGGAGRRGRRHARARPRTQLNAVEPGHWEVLNFGRRGADFPALRENFEQALAHDPNVIVYGMMLDDAVQSESFRARGTSSSLPASLGPTTRDPRPFLSVAQLPPQARHAGARWAPLNRCGPPRRTRTRSTPSRDCGARSPGPVGRERRKPRRRRHAWGAARQSGAAWERRNRPTMPRPAA